MCSAMQMGIAIETPPVTGGSPHSHICWSRIRHVLLASCASEIDRGSKRLQRTIKLFSSLSTVSRLHCGVFVCCMRHATQIERNLVFVCATDGGTVADVDGLSYVIRYASEADETIKLSVIWKKEQTIFRHFINGSRQFAWIISYETLIFCATWNSIID